MSLRCSLFFVPIVAWLLFANLTAHAQSAEIPKVPDFTAPGLVEEIMSSAENRGLPVIVINAGTGSSGEATQTSAAVDETPATASPESSVLMKIQSDALELREFSNEK